MAKAGTRSRRNIKWVEQYCRVPEGKDVGKPLKLRAFQKAALAKIYDNPYGTRRAIISFGRKNAKTTLAACLLLLHLAGPEARSNSRLNSAAQSRDQAAILFSLAARMVRLSPDLSEVVTIRDTAKQLLCPRLGTLYRALSADASTAYGLSPVFIVHDELGQVKGPRSELYDALEQAVGAHENPLSIVISTQAPSDTDLLSLLIDDALAGKDPRVVLVLYTAAPEINPFSVKAIRQACPAYGDFLVAAQVKQMAGEAKRMPSREAQYRNYILNQRVNDKAASFIARSVWKGCGARPLEDFSGQPVYGALDLSAVNDLTALVWITARDGVWQVKPVFWLPEHGLRDKAQADRVPYDLWKKQGFLLTTPGNTIEYKRVAEHLFAACGGMEVRKIAFDAWNFRYLKPWLSQAGFEDWQLEEEGGLFDPFGQGYKSMSPALRVLESDILNRKIAHGNHPVLEMCAANAVVQTDPAGNRKLAKDKSYGRIDGMVALAMARSVAEYATGDPRGAAHWEEEALEQWLA